MTVAVLSHKPDWGSIIKTVSPTQNCCHQSRSQGDLYLTRLTLLSSKPEKKVYLEINFITGLKSWSLCRSEKVAQYLDGHVWSFVYNLLQIYAKTSEVHKLPVPEIHETSSCWLSHLNFLPKYVEHLKGSKIGNWKEYIIWWSFENQKYIWHYWRKGRNVIGSQQQRVALKIKVLGSGSRSMPPSFSILLLELFSPI